MENGQCFSSSTVNVLFIMDLELKKKNYLAEKIFICLYAIFGMRIYKSMFTITFKINCFITPPV